MELNIGGTMHFKRFQKEFSDLPGFTQPESMCIWDFLLELQSQTWPPASLLEIGVYYGQSAMMLALHCRSTETVLLVDPTDYVEEARKNLSRLGVAKFEIIKARSSESQSWALASRYTHALRWIHVDGDHKAEAVWNDLSLANHLLADTGLICIDDFFNPGYPQVTYTVCQFLEQNRDQLQLFLCGYNKGYLARPGAMQKYLQSIRQDLANGIIARGFTNFTIFKTDYPNAINAFGVVKGRFQDLEYYGLDEEPERIVY
jgi:predicted O-methyltransferase YrrM